MEEHGAGVGVVAQLGWKVGEGFRVRAVVTRCAHGCQHPAVLIMCARHGRPLLGLAAGVVPEWSARLREAARGKGADDVLEVRTQGPGLLTFGAQDSTLRVPVPEVEGLLCALDRAGSIAQRKLAALGHIDAMTGHGE